TDRQVVYLQYRFCYVSDHMVLFVLKAVTMVFTLCFTIPIYVPSGVPGIPKASENRLPPIVICCPRCCTPASTAFSARSDTELSTKTAGIARVTIKSTKRETSRRPNSD